MAGYNNQNRYLSEKEVAVIVALREEGRSQQYIAERLGAAQSSVSRALRRFRETGEHRRRAGQGRNRVTSARQDRFLRLNALRQRFVTARSLRNQLFETHNVAISVQTTRNRLKEFQLFCRRPARGPRLTAAHRRARLAFAREHVNWQQADWRRILFTDESRFLMRGNDRRERVYRRNGERFAQCNFAQTDSFGGGSIMIWGGISLDGRTDLVVLQNGTLNAERYITNILEDNVVPVAAIVGDDFVLMHDNARPHAAAAVRNYLGNQNIATLNWPARSPDLNPIEHVWDIMGRQFRARRNPPATLNELGVVLQEIWDNIDQELISNLILSMNHRCQAVIAARGGNTKY